jgi:hypothetical protein
VGECVPSMCKPLGSFLMSIFTYWCWKY